jgi:RNA polymerase sigma-70 factor (ECF subfamily)
MAILNNDAETEDAMQSAYINAYEHLAQFEKRAAFATWLTRIMVNECLKLKKKRLKETAELSENHINMITPAHVLVNKELSGLLENAVSQLPEKYRLVFMLREMEDMSVRETAEVLTIEETNVKVRLNRAKTMLRENLKDYIKGNIYHFHLSRCDRMVNNVMAKINTL